GALRITRPTIFERLSLMQKIPSPFSLLQPHPLICVHPRSSVVKTSVTILNRVLTLIDVNQLFLTQRLLHSAVQKDIHSSRFLISCVPDSNQPHPLFSQLATA
ncbi:MAG: hypothetical protein AAGH40_05800, partial [Verrucomicrobiota bacterium]